MKYAGKEHKNSGAVISHYAAINLFIAYSTLIEPAMIFFSIAAISLASDVGTADAKSWNDARRVPLLASVPTYALFVNLPAREHA